MGSKRKATCKPTQQLPTLLEVVASVLAVVYKRMQQLPTMLGPAVYRGKIQPMRLWRLSVMSVLGPRQQCWKSCANGSNIVALRFGNHGTKEMLGVVGSKV